MNTKKLRLVLLPLILLAAVAAAVFFWRREHAAPAHRLTLYGNIDIREVQLAFNASGRIQSLAVREGDAVKAGRLVARLDPVRYADAVAQARSRLAAQAQVLARLEAGSRPEEIAQARAQAAAAQAALDNAEATYRRQVSLAQQDFVSPQAVDNAAAALKGARAELAARRQALALAVKGPRKEDIDAARAALEADRAALALARRELADTSLYAPASGVIDDRILEPGDMANPQTPVYTLALSNPVWARVYVPETALGRVRPGMRADIANDSFPGRRFRGWIGYVSPTAEFTPKTVETPELRTQLVYQARVYACNPEGALRLGMPVTVTISLRANASGPAPETDCRP